MRVDVVEVVGGLPTKRKFGDCFSSDFASDFVPQSNLRIPGLPNYVKENCLSTKAVSLLGERVFTKRKIVGVECGFLMQLI